MGNQVFFPTQILLPKEHVQMEKWSVIACDQYTSDPDYWEKVEDLVGSYPSALRMMIPEIYLEQKEVSALIESVNYTMHSYCEQGIFQEEEGMVFVKRTLANGQTRLGLVGAVDLEQYDYHSDAASLIRATEGTVLSRIPPRTAVRKDAPLELPHVMLLLDDADEEIIKPLQTRSDSFHKLYDFDLMLGAGHVTGFRVPLSEQERITSLLHRAAEKERFEKKYGMKDKAPVVLAVGGGNHSLAAAKSCYEALKQTLPQEQVRRHPARFALVEIVNLYDASLSFEPIHRVVFDVDPDRLFRELSSRYDLKAPPADGQRIRYIAADRAGECVITNPSSGLAVGSLQNFLDDYLEVHGGRVDYVHGEESVLRLGRQPGNMGFLLPEIRKDGFFETILADGAFPRKTFSMGHADDKRFYLESRRISMK